MLSYAYYLVNHFYDITIIVSITIVSKALVKTKAILQLYINNINRLFCVKYQILAFFNIFLLVGTPLDFKKLWQITITSKSNVFVWFTYTQIHRKLLLIIVFAYSYTDSSKPDLSKFCELKLSYSVLLIEKQMTLFQGRLKQVSIIFQLTFNEQQVKVRDAFSWYKYKLENFELEDSVCNSFPAPTQDVCCSLYLTL